jgi:hypothetical protein
VAVNFRDRFQRHRQGRASGLTVEVLAEELRRAAVGCALHQDWSARSASLLVKRLSEAEPYGAAANLAMGGALAECWRRGWQPIDVWQILRRRVRDELVGFVVGAIADEAGRYAPAAVHPRWRAQLAELDATVWWDRSVPYPEAWADRAGAALADLVSIVLEALDHLGRLQPQPVLLPPPGSAEATRARAAGSPGEPPGSPEVDAKVLAKVRALLAKAESTEFPDEADAFFAKAQELMSRYSLERAAIDALADAGGAGTIPVRTAGRRIWLDNPYLSPKSMLVGAVAEANRCRAVFASGLGLVTVIGEETDTDIVEVLTTSLLVQAGRAMLAAGSRTDQRGQSRTKSFRQSFLISYAQRIGERLNTAAEQAESEVSESVGDGRLLPVLAARERAVQERVSELFPLLVSRRVSVSNNAGWTAGRAAADLAVLDVRRAVRG